MNTKKNSLYMKITCVALFTIFLGGCGAKRNADVPATEMQDTESLLDTEAVTEKESPRDTEQLALDAEALSTESDNSIVDASKLSVTLIGDSVMLGAEASIESILPSAVVDAAESRQVVKGESILENLNSTGSLYDTVVLALGTNGPFKQETGQKMIDYLGSDRNIYWITTYGSTLTWQEESNDVIRAIAEENDNVTIIDWAAYAESHPEWFYSDGIHLNGDGRVAYAQLIYDSLCE